MSNEYNNLTGVQKAAIILLSIDENLASKVFEMMNEEEIKAISFTMSSLGRVRNDVIERLLLEFSEELTTNAGFIGNLETTEKLLEKVIPKDKVSSIMEEIRGPSGKTTWDKLTNVNEDILASYLRNEYPQTVALIISKLPTAYAAKVLSILPEEFVLDILLRILSLDSVKKDVLEGVEKTLRNEFISTISKTQKYDTKEMIAEIFNNFDRTNEAKFMGMLEEIDPESAEKIKNLMFTFDDLVKMDSDSVQTVLRIIDKGKLTVALKGASEDVKNMFLNSMSQRAAKILQEDMEAMGPVRLKDVDEAQNEIINKIKELEAKGEIIISDSGEKDEFIY